MRIIIIATVVASETIELVTYIIWGVWAHYLLVCDTPHMNPLPEGQLCLFIPLRGSQTDTSNTLCQYSQLFFFGRKHGVIKLTSRNKYLSLLPSSSHYHHHHHNLLMLLLASLQRCFCDITPFSISVSCSHHLLIIVQTLYY